MTGGILLVSRWVKLFAYYKKMLELLGFRNVIVTSEEKDSLNMLINELKPRLVLVGSCFYKAATPYMLGQLRRSFPRLAIAVINIHEFPDDMAPWFIWFGVTSYVNNKEGVEEFHRGMEEVRQGRSYIAPNVKQIFENTEWPDIKNKADKRQLDVLMFICNGIQPLEIGNRLQISKRTVDWHIEELKKVFGVQNREELISIAFYLDIVTKDDLCFFDRKIKARPLPKWAVLKQRTMNREQRAMSS